MDLGRPLESAGDLARKLLAQAAEPVAVGGLDFDRRPGALEATHGLIPAREIVVVGGQVDGQPRQVILLGKGGVRLAALEPHRARDLARALRDMAELCEFGWPE